MTRRLDYEIIIDYRLQNIPCKIGVISYNGQLPHKGSSFTCDSDWDYYGFFESEWEILDRKGWPAKWLASKLTAKDNKQIEDLIYSYCLKCKNEI